MAEPRSYMTMTQYIKYRKWILVVAMQARPTLWQWIRLWFVPWRPVYAPDGSVFIREGLGSPLYRYKILDGRVFYLSPYP